MAGAIAKLKAVLGIDNKQYKAGMRDSTTATERFQKKLASAGRLMATAFSVGKIVEVSKQLVAFSSEIQHTSENLGMTTDEFQAINSEALKFGLTTENMRDRLGKLTVVQGRVREGNKAYHDALKTLNIDARKFVNSSPAGAFEMLAKGVAGAANEQEALNALSKLYSEENAPRLVAMLKSIGNDGMQAVIDKAKEAGHVIDSEMIQKLEKLGTKTEQLKLKLKVGMAQAASFADEHVSFAARFYGALVGGSSQKDAMKQAIESGVAPKPKPKPTGGTDFDIVDPLEQKRAQIKKQFADRMEREQERVLSMRGKGASVSSQQRMGGFVGRSRGALGIADRQQKIMIEGQKRLEQLTKEMNEKLQDLVEKTPGTGAP